MRYIKLKIIICVLLIFTFVNTASASIHAEALTKKTIRITIVNSKGKRKSKEKTVEVPETSTAFSKNSVDVTRYSVPKNKGFKSFLRYKKITSPSLQLTLQKDAITDEHGLRKVDGRYLVAIGTYFKAPVGTYIDLKLQNDTVIPCIVGDIKANKDTDRKNIFTRNGCCSEFIVDESKLPRKTRTRGNISVINKKWNSPVSKIYVYDYKHIQEKK